MIYNFLENKKIAKQGGTIAGNTRKEIEEHAKEIGIHFTTLYRWLSGYKSTGTVTGLLSQKRGRKNA